jgi:hypothetical protein
LSEGYHPSGMKTDGQEVTYTLGNLQMKASRRDLDKQKLLEQMIDDEVVLGEPKNFVRWMTVGWVLMGLWYLRDDWKEYKEELMSE